MAKRKRKETTKKVITVLASLAVLELVYLLIMGTDSSVPLMDGVNKEVAKQLAGQSLQRREVEKVKAAVLDYQLKHGGKPPDSLQLLIPTYFERVPMDPASGQEMKYRVEGTRFYVGEPIGRSGTTAVADGSAEMSPEARRILIASLAGGAEEAKFVYDPTNKRDPFAPFNFAPPVQLTGNTPLERYPLEQLSYTAFAFGDEPAAIVETPDAKGFRIKKGMKIGTNNGEVVEILADKILILETETGIDGTVKHRSVELNMRKKAINP